MTSIRIIEKSIIIASLMGKDDSRTKIANRLLTFQKFAFLWIFVISIIIIIM
ncbi:hypothetical protein KY341_06150 [Candidatus Woesearchaeota archaeon]|nr:hypothetical protein [Candidatus Woesearchaeota archaeon]